VLLPDGAGEKQQATVRVFGQRQLAFALLCEGVTMLGRDSHPAFRIEIDC
jgi:hypothetical protein